MLSAKAPRRGPTATSQRPPGLAPRIPPATSPPARGGHVPPVASTSTGSENDRKKKKIFRERRGRWWFTRPEKASGHREKIGGWFLGRSTAYGVYGVRRHARLLYTKKDGGHSLDEERREPGRCRLPGELGELAKHPHAVFPQVYKETLPCPPCLPPPCHITPFTKSFSHPCSWQVRL